MNAKKYKLFEDAFTLAKPNSIIQVVDYLKTAGLSIRLMCHSNAAQWTAQVCQPGNQYGEGNAKSEFEALRNAFIDAEIL